MSLPTTADVFVNCVPVNCMPSPESPAKRMVTVSTSSKSFSTVSAGVSMTELISIADCGLRIADCRICSSFNPQSAIHIPQSLSSFLCIHDLCRDGRQVHRLFRVTLGEVRDHVADGDRADELA